MAAKAVSKKKASNDCTGAGDMKVRGCKNEANEVHKTRECKDFWTTCAGLMLSLHLSDSH